MAAGTLNAQSQKMINIQKRINFIRAIYFQIYKSLNKYPLTLIVKKIHCVTLAKIFIMLIKTFLLDGPPAIFFIGGFLIMIVIPVAVLIFLIVYFIKRNRRKKQEDQTVS